jgi:manganese-dependent inorganic pyrophosphatase
MERNPATISPEMRVMDAKKTIIKTPSRSLPVVDDLWRVVGVVTGTDLLRARGKGVILVDHNELFQAVDGIEEAEVLEVVDHHRIGDLQSTLPISFTGEPVGATSTLIQEKYERSFVSPTKEIAGILLAGILSDTLLLRSPTTTEKDKEIAEKLSLIAGVNMNEFGMEMFRHASSIAGKEIKDVIASNFKEYEIEGRMIGIGQSETIDGEGLLKRRRDFEKELKRIKDVHKLDLAIMVISDVIKEGSFILSSGDQDVIQQAFGTAEKTHGAIFLKGVLSRKKQILPAIGQALKAYDDAL